MLLTRLPRPQLLTLVWSIRNRVFNGRFIGNDNGPTKPIPEPLLNKQKNDPSDHGSGTLLKKDKPSLYELLFPEESIKPINNRKVESEDSELELELEWNRNPEVQLLDQVVVDKSNGSEQPDSHADSVDHRVRERDEREALRRDNASVLVLSNVSKTLSESDFFRLAPRGKHIDSWSSGIIKVIPGRDSQTLERLGLYFILFASPAAAKIYKDRIRRLHKLSQQYTFSDIPLPSTFMKDGEDIAALLRAFTLLPASKNEPQIKLLSKPFSPAVTRLFHDGASQAIVKQQKKTNALVLFALDRGNISVASLEMILGRDGKSRNRPWNLWSGDSPKSAIHPLASAKELALIWKEQKNSASEGDEKKIWRAPSRYIIAFQDMKEARRFVRAWHRRELPSLGGERWTPESDFQPVASAEILW